MSFFLNSAKFRYGFDDSADKNMTVNHLPNYLYPKVVKTKK